jgi:hypothetical protein
MAKLKNDYELLENTIKGLEDTITTQRATITTQCAELQKYRDMQNITKVPTPGAEDNPPISPSPLQTPTLSNAPTPPGADAEHDDPLSPSPLQSVLVYMLASTLSKKRDKVVGRSFTKYFVLVLAILGSWYSLRGSLSSSRLDLYRAPEVPGIAGRLRHLEGAVSISADSRTTYLCRLNAIEKRILEADAKTQHFTTFFTPTGPPAFAWWNKLLTKLSDGQDITHRLVDSAVSTLLTKLSDGQDITRRLVDSAVSTLLTKLSDGQDITRRLVDSAVSTFSQDIANAKPDFALHSGGGRVIPSLTSPTFKIRPQGLISQIFTENVGRPPITALHHELQNGHCWSFAGGEGQLGVALASPVYVEEVTIDHVAKSVAFDRRSAPRQMEVWGLVEGKDNIARVRAWKEDLAARKEDNEVVDYPKTLPKHPEYIRLANFTYNINSPKNVQTFPVMPGMRGLNVDIGIVVLRMLNNWGRDDLTCLYRFRVHGQRIGIPAPYSDGS